MGEREAVAAACRRLAADIHGMAFELALRRGSFRPVVMGHRALEPFRDPMMYVEFHGRRVATVEDIEEFSERWVCWIELPRLAPAAGGDATPQILLMAEADLRFQREWHATLAAKKAEIVTELDR